MFRLPKPLYEGEGTGSSAPTPTPTPTPTPAPVPPAPAAPVTPPEPEKKPWYLTRIDELTGKVYELTEKTKQLENPPPAATPTPGKTYTQAELDRLANEKAANLIKVNDFNSRCNTAYAAGKEAHDDFDTKLQMLNTVSGGLMPQDLVEAALETGQGHEVLYKLGANPELAQEIVGLSPARMAVRLAKIADEIKTPPVRKQSGAPDPITPRIGQAGVTEKRLDDASLSTDEWMELRNKEAEERAKRRRK